MGHINKHVRSCQCKNSAGGWNRNSTLSIPSCGSTNNISNQNGELRC